MGASSKKDQLMKASLSFGILFTLAVISNGCCHHRCGYGCGRTMMFPDCSPCGGMSSYPEGYVSGCDSCGFAGQTYGDQYTGMASGSVSTAQAYAEYPMDGSQGSVIGPPNALSQNPAGMIGSGELFTQPLPPPLPSNGSMPTTTTPISSRPIAPMSFQSYHLPESGSPFTGNTFGGCPTCNH